MPDSGMVQGAAKQAKKEAGMEHLFLTNETEETFLQRIRENLRRCGGFSFSVSFIKKAGLVLLLKDMEAALSRGVRGRLITSTYQNFTDIESLKVFRRLMNQYSNFQCRLDFESFHDEHYSAIGYHSKGYIFDFSDHSEIVIGSSNITRYALLKNVEWDLLLSVNPDSDVYLETMFEFENRWKGTEEVTLCKREKYSLYRRTP